MMRREVHHLGDGIEVHYYPSWYEDRDRLLAEAEKSSFTEEVVTMFQKANVIKRRTVDYGLEYSYNPSAKRSIQWESFPLFLKQRLEEQFRVSFQQCACNEYGDYESYIGPHHDKGTIIDGERREPLYIASVSAGAMRPMVLIPPGANLKGVPITVNGLVKVQGATLIELAPGSLLLFSNAFNREWKHSIPKTLTSTTKGKRISLTYRHF
jgi:alkylated DNA repair dioxygenase AlkB